MKENIKKCYCWYSLSFAFILFALFSIFPLFFWHKLAPLKVTLELTIPQIRWYRELGHKFFFFMFDSVSIFFPFVLVARSLPALHRATLASTVCCSVLQCVAECYSVWCSVCCSVCCSVLKCVADLPALHRATLASTVCCSVLQCVAVCYSKEITHIHLPALHRATLALTVCSSVFLFFAVCCSVLLCVLQRGNYTHSLACTTSSHSCIDSLSQCVAVCVEVCVTVCVAVCLAVCVAVCQSVLQTCLHYIEPLLHRQFVAVCWPMPDSWLHLRSVL